MIAVKLGMTQLWDTQGSPVPATVLQVGVARLLDHTHCMLCRLRYCSSQILDNQVVNVRTKRKEGYYALQIGGVNHPKPKNVSI